MELLLFVLFSIAALIAIEYRQRNYRPEGINGELHYLEYIEGLLSSKRKIMGSVLMAYTGYSILGYYQDYKVEFRLFSSCAQFKVYSEQSNGTKVDIDNFSYTKGCYILELSISELNGGKVSNGQLKQLLDLAINHISNNKQALI